jgi:hypothetical protein
MAVGTDMYLGGSKILRPLLPLRQFQSDHRMEIETHLARFSSLCSLTLISSKQRV